MWSQCTLALSVNGPTLLIRDSTTARKYNCHFWHSFLTVLAGVRIWGRGSSDDKSGLIGILYIIFLGLMLGVLNVILGRLLPRWSKMASNRLELSFSHLGSTKRLAVLMYERKAHLYKSHPNYKYQGAGELSKYLLKNFGKDAFAFIVDEGGMWTCSTSSCKLLMLASLAGFSEDLGAVIATPGVAEKGYIDMNVVVNGKGGHSSVPPPHTVLSEIFLSANPFTDLQNIEHWYFIRSSRALRRPSSSSPFSQCT